MSDPDEPLLRIDGMTKRYGGLVAVDELTLAVPAGSITGIIGPNGAGKSTVIGLLGGALQPSAGTILFSGADVTRQRAPERARLGIGRTYQIPRPFLDMTVHDNLAVAQASSRHRLGRVAALGRRQDILRRTGLADVADVPARQLPLLRRKRLEVARALALEPQLLLLDEVGAGLVDSELNELIALIREVGGSGVTIVLVEHVLRVVRECCSALVVLNFGRKLAEGAPAAILASDEVAAVYLGTSRAPADRPAPASAPSRSAMDLSALVAPVAKGSHSLLRLDRVTAAYGQAIVLREVNLQVTQGEVVAVLGANGAGKSSLAQVISGGLAIRSGVFEVDGVAASRLRPDQISALGIAHCMEGRRIFADLSVEQNLRIAARAATVTDLAQRLRAVFALFPILEERRSDPGTAMSGGQQQMLAIARALMGRPRLVIFDEISLGLAPIMMDHLYESLAQLRQAGLTMLIVEQDVDRALELADRAYVLEHGVCALEGPARTVRGDSRLRHLYVGAAD